MNGELSKLNGYERKSRLILNNLRLGSTGVDLGDRTEEVGNKTLGDDVLSHRETRRETRFTTDDPVQVPP